MRKCHTGAMSMAVTKVLRSFSGRNFMSWMEPVAATFSMSSALARPASASAASK